MESYTVDPVRKFETKGGVSQLISVPFAAAVGVNQVVYAAVATQRIRVMGWRAHSNTAALGSWTLKSGTLVTIGGPNWAPLNTAPVDIMPVVDSGYLETDTGFGLLVDVALSAVNFNIFIIVYTPGTI